MRLKRILATMGCLLLASVGYATEPSTACQRAIVAAESTLHTVYHANHASILIQQGDEVLVSRSYGGSVDEHSRFLLGSVTKTLHAAVSTRLFVKGILDLEDPVIPYLPSDLAAKLPSSWDALRVDHLLHHTSGIQDYLNRPDNSDQAATDRFLKTPHDLSELVEFQPLHLEFHPDTQYKYSNTNYLIMGHILNEKSGLSDKELMTEELVGPIGLADTGTVEGEWDSSIYGSSGIDPSNLVGVGNAYSSAYDLMQFLRALDRTDLAQPYLPQNWIDTMYSPDPDCHGDGCDLYGLGFSLRSGSVAGRDWVYHQGKLNTVSALVAKVPSLELNMTVVSDKVQYDNATLAEELFTRLIHAGCIGADENRAQTTAFYLPLASADRRFEADQ